MIRYINSISGVAYAQFGLLGLKEGLSLLSFLAGLGLELEGADNDLKLRLGLLDELVLKCLKGDDSPQSGLIGARVVKLLRAAGDDPVGEVLVVRQPLLLGRPWVHKIGPRYTVGSLTWERRR